jgi:hypothetical protein
MLILKRMQTDCTYRQGYLKTTLIDKTTKGKFIGTTDMTAFTDRLPKELQSAVVKCLYGPQVEEAWTDVVCNREFTVSDLDTTIK